MEKGEEKWKSKRNLFCEGSILCFISESNYQVIIHIKNLKKKTNQKNPKHFEIWLSYVAQDIPAFGMGNWLGNNQPKKKVNWLVQFQQSSF